LGYLGVGHAISRQEFDEQKQRTEDILRSRRQNSIPIISDCLTVIEPLAKALASREESNRTTRMLTIIFIRNRNSLGHEISAYIDYAHRLKNEDFTSFFLGKTKLTATTTDLSFYNWSTHTCLSTDTSNFRLSFDVNGIRFRCEHDRKIVHVDPQSNEYGDGTSRVIVDAPGYLQVVLYVITRISIFVCM
jgi:hypothetical protein